MIIFGFRTFAKTLAMLTLVCGRCQNPASHRLVQRSRWFTLFFIPLIPFSFSRFTVCAYCGATQKVSKQDAEQMIAGANSGFAQAPLQNGSMTSPQVPGEQQEPPRS